jgi:hypothetical protein
MLCHFSGRMRGPCSGDMHWVTVTVTHGPLWELIGRGIEKRVRIALCVAHDAITQAEGLCPPGCSGWCRAGE